MSTQRVQSSAVVGTDAREQNGTDCKKKEEQPHQQQLGLLFPAAVADPVSLAACGRVTAVCEAVDDDDDWFLGA